MVEEVARIGGRRGLVDKRRDRSREDVVNGMIGSTLVLCSLQKVCCLKVIFLSGVRRAQVGEVENGRCAHFSLTTVDARALVQFSLEVS